MNLAIIGAGQAGCALIAELIRGKFIGTITVFNGEARPPYQRPPLSKSWLLEESKHENLSLLPNHIAQHPCVKWIQERVIEIHPDQGKVQTSSALVHVDHIILATGTRARRLTIPGLASKQLHVVRTLSDAERLKKASQDVQHIVIVGAGFLAFELASSLRHPKKKIRILAKGDRALPQISVKTADRLINESPASIRVNASVKKYDKNASSLRTNHGVIPADLIIAAIGAEPQIELAKACGLASETGIPTDDTLLTAHPNVSAIGEVSEHYQPHTGQIMRVESISEANDSASICAKRLLGHPESFKSIPWFWSNQAGLKLQIAGIAKRFDQETVLIETENELAVIRHLGDRVTAIETIQAAKEFMAARRLFESGPLTVGSLIKAGSAFKLLQSSRS